ncbi:MAG: sigma-54-dependent Fis family transcriptional regulator [Acidobacteria bacterium]|nr:sigma-54-dependent Fis family transcriptional regulator [Acidobacteriota bacterium]
MPKEKILIVDDEEMMRSLLAESLKDWGYEISTAANVNAALSEFESEQPALILLDINLPDGSGLDALREIKHRQADAVIIMITSEVIIENTLAALRGGAYDFIAKPVNLEELQVTIRNGIEAQTLRKEVRGIRRERAKQFSFEQIIGNSASLREVIQLARKVAASEVSSVLLQGESGTGKDLVAKAIHYASRRADAPFVAINCAAIPANLIESELFGYEKGAFTDAKIRKEGLFEQAEGGTLLLDEIGELELGLQAKLLRVLEEGTFRRVGGLKDVPLDVRIVVATNRDLKRDSEAGRFRLDLFYRFSVIQIDMPALRERDDDVITLANYYLAHFNKQFSKRVRGLSPEVSERFRQYRWPGNVRELRNVIERVMILEESDIITPRYLPHGFEKLSPAADTAGSSDSKAELAAAATEAESAAPFEPTSISDPLAEAAIMMPALPLFQLPPDGLVLEELELSLVKQALDRCGGNQTRAAEMLGISRDQLRYRLKKLEEGVAEG